MTQGPQHLAQFNIARIRYPLDDSRMKQFVDNVARVNGLADTIKGFVWRLQDESGNAMNMRIYDDPRILPNLTLWKNVEALERFVWQTLHRRFYGRRDEWFERIETPLVLWFVPERQSLAWRKASSGSTISKRTARATMPAAGIFFRPRNSGRRRAMARKTSTRHDQAHR